MPTAEVNQKIVIVFFCHGSSMSSLQYISNISIHCLVLSGLLLRLGDETIMASDHVCLLGVTISSDLSPVKHVVTISSSCFY